jgi:serine protease Do
MQHGVGRASALAAAVLIAAAWSTPGRAAAPDEGFADLVEQVEPSVVSIEITKSAGVRPMQFGGDPRAQEFMQRFFGMPGQGEPRPAKGAGSGFVVEPDGYIVTNNHVIDGADDVSVRFVDGRELAATIVGQDDKTDLALLKVDALDLATVDFGDSDDTRVGDWVVAIGNPFGLGGTATAGIVSARGRDIRSGPYDDYLQIDAPINQGNSGGPVFNTEGKVVGVNTAIFSPNGGSVGIGFAIPSNQVSEIVAELKTEGTVSRGWLGVSLQSLDAELAASLGLDDAGGALVAAVVPNSPAMKAGLQPGDVITGYDGDDVADARALSRLVGAADPGDKVSLEVWRGDAHTKISAKLGVPENAVASSRSEQSIDDLGLSVAPLDDALRSRLGVEDDIQGAVVSRVEPGSKASGQGIRRGDILLEVDRQPVTSAADLLAVVAAAQGEGRDSVPVLIRRGEAQRFAVLPVA